MENDAVFQKAKRYSFLLLKFRQRSQKEIYQRLKKKKFQAQIINRTLTFLKDKGFLDDGLFARDWINSRIKKPLGISRINRELRQKGIPQEIINSRIEELKKNYSEENTVLQIAAQRLEKQKGVQPQKAKRRVYAYLLRRGFSPDVVIDAIRQL